MVFRIIDTYILRRFLLPFILASVAVLGLYIVIDAFQKFDDLLRSGLAVSLRYYLYQVPVVLGQITPAIVLVAVVFAVLRMERRNEITAMLLSGTSLLRALLCFYCVGAVITLALLANQQWVVPKLGLRILETEWKALETAETIYRDVIVRDDRKQLFWIKRFDFVTKVMEDVSIIQFYPGGEPREYTRAKRIEYSSPEGLWKMSQCETRSYLRTGHLDKSKGLGGVAAYEEKLLESGLKPSEIGTKELEAAFMSYTELWHLTRKYPHLKALRVVLHQRLAFPGTTLVALLLCLPLVMRRWSEKPLARAGIATAVFLVFFAFFITSVDQGMKGNLPPVLSCWLPLGLFGAAGIMLLAEMRS